MENVIYNELRMRGYSVNVGVIPIAEKDKDGKVTRKQLEVDFVCTMGSVRYYIQSAYSLPDETKRIQEIRPFRRIDDSFKKNAPSVFIPGARTRTAGSSPETGNVENLNIFSAYKDSDEDNAKFIKTKKTVILIFIILSMRES